MNDVAESEEPHPNVLNGGTNWDSIILIALFIGGQRFGEYLHGDGNGLPWAIGLVSIWGIKSMVARYREGHPVGRFLPLLLLYLVARGALGIIFDSEDLYFGIGIGTKVAIGLVLLGSVVIGQPLVEKAMPYVFPFERTTREHPIYRSTMSHLTLFAAAFELLSSIWDVWLLQNSSATGYLLIRLVVGFVLGFGSFFIAFFYARWRLDKIPGFEGLFPMLERMATDMGKPVEA
ncbi:MAG: hypothetical protein HKN26_00155 [Acidimicrobiales bacterium]|nr:hypothetical protein [Acidimicrobiales bacterium]